MSYKKSSHLLRNLRYTIPYYNTDIEDKIEIECSICLEVMNKNNKIIKLYCCDHIYHEKCIRGWIEKNRNCPLCRKSIDEDKDSDKCLIL